MDEGLEQDRLFASDDVGARLRLAREEQGLSIAEVAERTRIPRRHLALIEDGDFAGLPAPTYSVGFVKTYAKLLGLDGIDLSQRFRRALAYAAPSPAPTAYEPAEPPTTPTRAIAWTCFALALLLVGGYLYWRGTSGESDGLRLAAQTDDRGAPAAPPPPHPFAVPAPAAASGATLTATSAVWIKVYEMGGATLKLGVLQPGETYQVPADAIDPRLITGRPNAIDVKVGGQAIPALGPPERRIADVSLKPAELVARTAPPASTPAATPVAPAATPLAPLAPPAGANEVAPR